MLAERAWKRHRASPRYSEGPPRPCRRCGDLAHAVLAARDALRAL